MPATSTDTPDTLHHHPEPPPCAQRRRWRWAEAVWLVLLGFALVALLDVPPVFASGLTLWGVLSIAARFRLAQCAKPSAITFSREQVRVTQPRFWSRQPAQQVFPVADFKAVCSHFEPGAFTGSGQVPTVLLFHASHRTPLRLDVHAPEMAKTRWGWAARPADRPAAAQLRASVAQVTGLLDLGFIGTCHAEQLKSAAFRRKLLAPQPPAPAVD